MRSDVCFDHRSACLPSECAAEQSAVRARTGAQVNTTEAVTDATVAHGFARINVGTKIVTRYIVEAFGQQDVLGGKLFRLLHPTPHGGLGNSKRATEFVLAASSFDNGAKGFVSRHG